MSNVLSLFDGMSCGMLAMQKAGVDVENYYAYEIDKQAIKTSQHNFPQIEQCGDVYNADFTKHQDCEWLIGGSPCFTKGHFVLTANGYRDISDIKIGDYVLTHKGRYEPVVAVGQKQAEIFEVKAMGYPTFRTTANHPFYTIRRRKATYSEYKECKSWRIFSTEPEWKRADVLDDNDFVGMHTINKSGTIRVAEQLDTEFCYILGRYLADGHLRKTKRKNRKNSYQYQVILSIGENKVGRFRENVKHTHFSCYKHSQSVYRCVFSSQELLEYIDKYIGHGSHNKKIPEIIYMLEEDKQLTFLRGYMDGDGCKTVDAWMAATVSPYIAYGLQRLITGLYKTNVSVSVSENNRTHTINGREIKANYPLYQITYKEGLKKQAVAHIQDNILWTQVKSTRQTQNIETVYNLTVANDNSYTVNNCIVHNCTYWSIAQSPNKRETTASGIGWELFSQYVRALHEAKPKYFIYENNKSMSKAIRESITETFGFEPVCINSALVSAQNRQRLYWVGKRNADGTYSKVDVQQPEDRGILLKDITDSRNIKTDTPTYQHLEARTDGKTNAITTVSKDNLVAEPMRCFTLPREDGLQTQSKQYRVYETNGKSTTLCAKGGGMGAKTGLYAIPIEFDDDVPTKAWSEADGKTYKAYEVKSGNITIKGKTYPIKLTDGYYIIRKLTVSECKRLQTVPEWYQFPVSNTAAYKMLGNGWTVDVIAHLIRACQREEIENYEH